MVGKRGLSRFLFRRCYGMVVSLALRSAVRQGGLARRLCY